jgi:hypothetical protein
MVLLKYRSLLSSFRIQHEVTSLQYVFVKKLFDITQI